VRNYSNVQHGVKGLYSHSFDTRNILTLGGDFMRDYLMSYQFKDNGSYIQYVSDVFAQYDWTPTERLNIISGLRYDYFSEANVSHLSPKVGLMYKQQHFTYRGSYAGGFRAPTLKEMYMNFDMASVFMIYGNRDLKAESSHNFSLSGEYTQQYFNFSLTGYYNIVDNRITTAWNTALKGMQHTNIDNITITGLDANASVRFPSGLNARISYTFTHESIEKGQPLVSQTRPHTATARIEYGKNGISTVLILL
jgi:outer membrane receptor for ferrienterochelin and colicins